MDFSKAFLSYNNTGDYSEDYYDNEFGDLIFRDIDLDPYKDILIKSSDNKDVPESDDRGVKEVSDGVSDFNKWELEQREKEEDSLEGYELNGNSMENAMIFKRLLHEEKIPVNITSGFRRGARTKQGNKSHHSFEGGTFAFDVVPKEGYGFNDIYDKIFNSDKLVRFMEVNKIGIIDESDKEMLALTGGTAPHLHIGFDKLAVSQFKERYDKLFSNKKVSRGEDGMKILDVNEIFNKYYTSKNNNNINPDNRDVYSDEKAVNDIIPFIKN